MKIRNIVFDFGNVLTVYDPEGTARAAVAAVDGRPDDEKAARVCEEFYHSPENRLTDTGILLPSEMAAVLCGRFPEDGAYFAWLIRHRGEYFRPPEGTGEVLHALHDAGFHLYYLSNTSDDVTRALFRTHEYFSLLEDGILSFRELRMKPDPRIFRLLLDRCGIDPAESLFIDDLPRNTAAARDCGLRTITLPRPTDLRGELEAVLGAF